MSENVYDIVQLGAQVGTFVAPGVAVPATIKYPISDHISPELDLGSAYPKLDRGRNVKNLGGSGYHGVRKASVPLPSEVRFEDIWWLLERIYAGGIIPTGSNPYTRVYPYETGAASVIPMTIETGNIDSAAAQERLVSALISSLQMGFTTIDPGSASPWTLSADILAFDREVSALTPGLTEVANPLETVQGHLTRLYEGSVATAFGALAELGSSLKSFTMTAERSLALRAYGSTSDRASKFGYTDMSNATYELVVAVSPTAKTDLHDTWNTSGATIGERRLRVKAIGTGSKVFQIDARAGMFAIPWDDANGERVYKVTGEFADDATLDASHVITLVNTIA